MQNFTNRQKATPFSGYQAGQQTLGPQQTVQTSMGNFPNLQAYQQQQDAFVQQHLKNQAQYNQVLQSGQSPQRVPVMEAWKQAGENVQSGQYQGNPFQTGNVDAIMGMFGQYGIQAPQGFRDQLLQNLGQQSAPPMYQPQPQMTYPGGPRPPMAPGYGGRIGLPPGSPVTMDFRDRDGDMIDDRNQLGPGQAPPAVYNQPVTDGPIGPNGEYWPAFRSPPAMTYPGGPMQPPAAAPGYGARIRDPGGIFTSQVLDRDGDGIDDRNQLGPSQPFPQAGYPGGPMPSPPFPGAIRVDGPRPGWISPPDPIGGMGVFTDDWLFEQPRQPSDMRGGPSGPLPGAGMPPNPSDPWSYPLRPGHTRGPSGEQIMTREAREAEIRRMEQESGRTYVRPKAGVTNGGWLPPARQNPGSSISLNPEQAAGMRQYMESRQASRAQPTPPRTQGTPYRGRRR